MEKPVVSEELQEFFSYPKSVTSFKGMWRGRV